MDDLRKRRRAVGLSQSQLSFLSRVPASTISQAEARGLRLLAHQQYAIEKVLRRCAREQLRTLQKTAMGSDAAKAEVTN